MKAQIRLENVNLNFRTYRNPSPALKERVLGLLSGRAPVDDSFDLHALKDVSLTIESGDRVGIIGLNGAGKSTLLKTIVGIYTPSSGAVRVDGQVTPLIEMGTGFDLEMSGRENIYLIGALLTRSPKEMRAREHQIIEFSGLSEFMDMPIKYYSSGMLGRLAFSIGTMVDPEILLVDEVFAAGDALFVDRARERMLALFDSSHIVVMVSHEMAQIESCCNRVIVMHAGAIVADGPPGEMIEYYHRNIVGRSVVAAHHEDFSADIRICEAYAERP